MGEEAFLADSAWAGGKSSLLEHPEGVLPLSPRHAGNRSPAARNRFFRILLDIHGHTWP